jgi:hypothetical protein
MRGLIIEVEEPEPEMDMKMNVAPSMVGEAQVPIPHEEYDLGERDNYLNQIEKQIKNKRDFLLKKRSKVEHLSKENEFLENIKNDYQKYYNVILKQKQDQMKAMELLHQYIDDIKVSGKLTDQDMINTKKEQNTILGEMDRIKKDLDGLIKTNETILQPEPSVDIKPVAF